ncbi:hypothetical protein OHA98_11560 [Streptomyces sp. NBC_00654]|uniref:hypothetical protein n=1 Tax=Streptomyces sp. NBC_00654 TaxID=2975799 RepID=UPI00224EA1A9|nr:hypothetical protein [Streptomyces sp. NBC_00654]MCX4965461.1 hypothetical protein [Streptomyces sp. NBC_00654]
MPISASVRSRGTRTGTAVAAALAVAGLTLAAAPAAYAAPGDSGDLSVQSAGQQRGNNRDGAPVCAFKLVAANFETLPAVPFTVTAQPPTVPPGDTLVGTLALSQGRAISQEYLLPDGTYQLQWVVPVGLKQKTFTIDCERQDRNQGRQGSQGSQGNQAGEGGQEGQSGQDGQGGQGSQSGQSGQGGQGGQGGQASQSGQSGSEGSSWSGEDKGNQPSGAVPAGGGGVPTMETVSSESGSGFGTGTALAASAAGVAGLILVRRSARRRASGAA